MDNKQQHFEPHPTQDYKNRCSKCKTPFHKGELIVIRKPNLCRYHAACHGASIQEQIEREHKLKPLRTVHADGRVIKTGRGL